MSPMTRQRSGPALLAAVGVGFLVAGQSRVNGDLGRAVNDGVTAAVISFGVGWLLLTITVVMRASSRRGFGLVREELRTGGLRWWHLTGGLYGAALVAEQGGVVPTIGVALFSIALVGGNTAGAIVVDRLGIGPGGRRDVSVQRVIAAVLATIGVGVAAAGDAVGDAVATSLLLALMALVIITGAFTALQAAVNGQVMARSGDTFVASWVNFTVGLAALVLGWLALHLPDVLSGQPAAWTLPPTPWDNPVVWLGGFIGVTFIAVTSLIVRPLGVLLLGLGNVVGQLTGALALDALAPVGQARITAGLVLGSLITMIAVGIGASGQRRRKVTT